MKATELQIGDWVYVSKNFTRKYHKIRELSNDDNTVLGGTYVNEYGVTNNSIFSPNDTEPIPITPKILKKNGWRSRNNGSGDFILTKPMVGNSATITKTINGYEMSHGVFNGLSIRYIHQLQHALRLCGIKKEIKYVW